MINPNDAPKGYMAQQTIGWSCERCAFYEKPFCLAPTHPCLDVEREDKQFVIFVKKDNQNEPNRS